MPETEREITQEERDAGRRLADAVNLHVHAVLAEGSGRERPGFVAIRLADGRSPDGSLFDSRKDAARHHQHEPAVFFVKVGREVMSEREAIIVLQMHRMAFRRGVRFVEHDVITPQLPELLAPFMPRTLGALTFPKGLIRP